MLVNCSLFLLQDVNSADSSFFFATGQFLCITAKNVFPSWLSSPNMSSSLFSQIFWRQLNSAWSGKHAKCLAPIRPMTLFQSYRRQQSLYFWVPLAHHVREMSCKRHWSVATTSLWNSPPPNLCHPGQRSVQTPILSLKSRQWPWLQASSFIGHTEQEQAACYGMGSIGYCSSIGCKWQGHCPKKSAWLMQPWSWAWRSDQV